MANTKISGLTDGTTAVGTDVFPIARSGANYNLSITELLAYMQANITAVAGSGGLLGVQRFTPGTSTYTPTAGTTFIIFELQAGGGGGCGAAVGAVNPGGGGGGGGWLRKKLTANFSGATVVCGAGGAGGTAGNNAGTAGGNSTFTDTAGSPTTYTAGGGAGGTYRGTFAAPLDANRVAGGTATGGDDNQPGGASVITIIQNSNVGCAGHGGSSRYAAGATAVYAGGTTTVQGTDADGNGGGGSGAGSTNGGSNKRGGNGSDGVVIIWEYK